MRIAIVNDVKMTREFLKQIIENDGRHKVAWLVADGKEAVEMCAKNTPDLILMDLIMPIMNGVLATQLIMKHSPCAILIVTASVESNASMVFEAMGFGALDVVKTPTAVSGEAHTGDELLRKIGTIERYIGFKATSRPIQPKKDFSNESKKSFLIVIGSSTGGPSALAKLLRHLHHLPITIVIIQHIDEAFAASLAEWLGKQIGKQIEMIEEGVSLTSEGIFLAGYEKHLVLRPTTCLHYQNEPVEISYKPSVDVFFKSVAENWQGDCIALLLTGMGDDGAHGLRLLRNRGFETIAQSKESCVVFGMPKAAIEIDAAVHIFSLDEMCERLPVMIQNQRERRSL